MPIFESVIGKYVVLLSLLFTLRFDRGNIGNFGIERGRAKG